VCVYTVQKVRKISRDSPIFKNISSEIEQAIEVKFSKGRFHACQAVFEGVWGWGGGDIPVILEDSLATFESWGIPVILEDS
jgi:hypothetical protein